MSELNKISERIEKAIANFNGSFMSDTKWRKFFNALIEQEICVKEFNLKYMSDETIRQGSGVLFESKYEQRFRDNGFKDPGVGGPALFKEIEWIEFKDNVEFSRHHTNPELSHKKRVQLVKPIKELLESLGKFEYDIDQTSLKLYGYK